MKGVRILIWLLVLPTVALTGCDRFSAQGELKRQFQEVDMQLRRTAQAAERGDVNQAEFHFYQAHSFLHNIDLPLRNRGEDELGARIFELKNELEVEFAGERRAEIIARLASEVRTLLPDAARVMGAGYTPAT